MTNFVDNGKLLVPEENEQGKPKFKYRPKYLELDDIEDREALNRVLTKLYQKLSGGGIRLPVNRMQATIIETFAKTMIDENWGCEVKT